jgi:hypothetical protein
VIHAPVAAGQVRQYDPGYHRSGRILVVKYLGGYAGLWETHEIDVPSAVRNYAEREIYDIADLTQVQPGQRWVSSSAPDVLLMKNVIKTPGPITWLWTYENETTGNVDVLGEDLVVSWYSLAVGMIAPTKARKKETCPLCGEVGTPGFNMFRCKRYGCRNFHG